MEDIISQMIEGYLIAFNSYQIKDDSLQKEVDDYKSKLTDFANSFSDVVEFSGKFAESGLQEKYSALISKVAMSNLECQSENKDGKSNDTIAVVSVKEFVEQYRTSYDEVIKAKYRKRAKVAYEKIFEVADKTEDMLDAQIICEKDRLLWEIVPEDALDIFETTLEAMDPVQEATTITLIKNIESYKKAESDEELAYLLDLAEFDREQTIKNNNIRMFVAILFGKLLVEFNKCKIIIYEWENEEAVKKSVMGMIKLRHSLCRALTLLQKHYNMTFDDILKSEEMKIWLLVPGIIDGMGRIKTSMHPHNLDVFKEMIDNEIIQDTTIDEILMRKPKSMLWSDLEGVEKEQFNIKAEKRGEELNAHLLYHQFKDELFGHVKDPIKDLLKDIIVFK